MSRWALFVAWVFVWWSLPVACGYLDGRFANFIGFLVLAACTTTVAGFQLAWKEEAWNS